MDDRFRHIAALAATQHSVVSTDTVPSDGVDASMRSKWERKGLIERLGPRSFAIAGSSPTFQRAMAAGLADLAGFGVAAGRAGARLHGLDSFARRRPSFFCLTSIVGSRPNATGVLDSSTARPSRTS